MQGTGEKTPFDRTQLDELLDLGQEGIVRLIELQQKVTNYQGASGA